MHLFLLFLVREWGKITCTSVDFCFGFRKEIYKNQLVLFIVLGIAHPEAYFSFG